MDSVDGKVAVVTGGASGIGLALARRFLADGARVVVADVEADALDTAATTLGDEYGADRVLAVRTDVRDPSEVDALAAATLDRFGAVHVVCNNAGVGVGGLAWTVPDDRWRWIIDVNLLGVANGLRSFVPHLIAQGEGHVVNTASAAGLLTGPAMAPYYATKHAVVALSETLYFDLQLAESPVGVSVLCPEWVKTNIADSERNRPAGVSPMVWPSQGPGTEAADAEGAEAEAEAHEGEVDDGEEPAPRAMARNMVAEGIESSEVADKVLDAIGSGRFWVLTHDHTLEVAKRRWHAIASDGRPRRWYAFGEDE